MFLKNPLSIFIHIIIVWEFYSYYPILRIFIDVVYYEIKDKTISFR